MTAGSSVGLSAARLWLGDRIEIDDNGCWLWLLGRDTGGGYGRAWVDGRMALVHRLTWTLDVGPIPPGLQIDHLCRVRPCVNPAHLEPVTQRVNIARGESPSALNARKDRCEHGHPFDEANTRIIRNGDVVQRVCRTCRRDWQREQRRQGVVPAFVTHGKRSTYLNWSCRCAECRAANADYARCRAKARRVA